MTTNTDPASNDKVILSRVLDATIRIGLIAALAFWSFQIFAPFLRPVIWGILIAIATYPVFCWLRAKLGERNGLAAILFALLALAILITPTVMLSASLIDSAQNLAQGLKDGTVNVPAPPESVATWPVIGKSLDKIWNLASVNLEAALNQLKPQLKAFSSWLLSAVAGVGIGVLQFVISIFIAGVLLAKASGGQRAARAIFIRLAGERGEELAALAGATVRSVARGVLGVALIQALLAGIGLIAADVPAAGLWALLVLLLAVVQLPPILILGPIAIYVFSVASTVTAVVFMIWSIIVSASDSLLKPLFLGRGVEVPTLVFLIGAIGGMMLNGIIGLFVGPIILAISYTLFMAWLDEN
jgi:predicted PurR-regulated permease PerM